jgi:alcohol dehydrogenase (cytochrome c)
MGLASLQSKVAGGLAMYNHDYAATGFSKLAEITPKNAANLKQVCSYALSETSTFESSVVAINGTLYFTTGQYTYALDASNCALRWRVRHEMAGPDPPAAGTVRGVAIEGNRLFRGFRDGTVIAYDIKNGEQLWSTKLAEKPDPRPATIAAAPIAWNGMVFIGTSGAERACGCVMAGLDAATGKVVWTFQLVPTGNAPGAESWPKDVHVGGGSTCSPATAKGAYIYDAFALYRQLPSGVPGAFRLLANLVSLGKNPAFTGQTPR